jgi:predicted transcriptional regulator of viral defense system
MAETLSTVRQLIETHPGRLWTVHDLAEAAEVSPTDAKIAAERLVIHGELLRTRRGQYARPDREDAGP